MDLLTLLRTWLAGCVLVGTIQFLWAAEHAWGQEPSAPKSAEDQLAQRFTELQAELERLKSAGDDDAAKALAAELTRARNLFAGEFSLESTDVPELHAVGVHKGGTSPPGILKGNDRYTRGYAEVSVTHTAAPLILCASGVERLHLQFKLAPGVRVAAVILGGQHTPTPPIPKVDEAEVQKAIAGLDSDDFDTRKKAQDMLAQWGGLISASLQAEAKNPSAEVRAAIRGLLTAIEQNAPASPELAREVRAVKMLELIASPDAVKLLEKLAQGIDGAARTRAAKDALERLAKSSAATTVATP